MSLVFPNWATDENDEPVSIEFLNASKRKLFNPQELMLTIAT